jgi:hypothetical protein
MPEEPAAAVAPTTKKPAVRRTKKTEDAKKDQ